MTNIVWISAAMGHASNQRPLRHSFSEDRREFAVACGSRNEEGESLGRDCFPAEVLGEPNAKESDYKLPDIFFAGSYWVVSSAAANVLRAFDLGGGDLFPVKVLTNDCRAEVGDGWFCINFGNRKSSLVPEQSVGIRQRAQNRYRVVGMPKDNDLAVDRSALAGADIWIETQMWNGLFLSEGLGQALKNAKAERGFFLSKCRVVAN